MIKYNSLEEHLMKYVQKSNNPNGCWEWIGAKCSCGYGSMRTKNKLYSAHRISFELFVGSIPNNMEVCHSCDNPGCVNPKHLFLGTHQDNMDDMRKKNRQIHNGFPGESNGAHKITEQEVYKIREMIEQGYTQKEIAKIFNVCSQNISCIKTGKSWNWLK